MLEDSRETLLKKDPMSTRKLSLILAVALIGFCTFPTSSAATAESTTLQLRPVKGTYSLNEQVTVELWVQDVTSLYGVDIKVEFNPDAAQGVGSITPATDLFSPDWIQSASIDNETGEFHYAAIKMNPSTPVSGTGKLFSADLQFTQPGDIELTILPESQLSNRNAELIPFLTENATYTIEEAIFLPIIVANTSKSTDP